MTWRDQVIRPRGKGNISYRTTTSHQRDGTSFEPCLKSPTMPIHQEYLKCSVFHPRRPIIHLIATRLPSTSRQYHQSSPYEQHAVVRPTHSVTESTSYHTDWHHSHLSPSAKTHTHTYGHVHSDKPIVRPRASIQWNQHTCTSLSLQTPPGTHTRRRSRLADLGLLGGQS